MYSFDIFDTLITRDVATPFGIFLSMQKSLEGNNNFPEYVRTNFATLRMQAEKLARATYQKEFLEDIPLEKIYEPFEMLGNLNSAQIHELIELEKECELNHCIGIKENILRVKSLIEEKHKVVLISDMYLDLETIKRILCKADSVLDILPVYISVEHNKTKYSGTLYDLVREKEYKEDRWVHVGDHLLADGERAEEKGIETELYPFEQLLPWEEKALAANKGSLSVQRQLGISRLVRNNQKQIGIKESVAYQIGTSIGGCVLYPYVCWFLQTAELKGINRLYFIARDGYLLKQIADILIQDWKMDIETYYIYGSRKAWRLPAISKNFHDIYKLVEWSHPRMITRVEKLASVFGLSADELYPHLPIYCRNEELVLTEKMVRYLALRLNQNKDFLNFLIEKNREKRAVLLDYLKQEIDVSDDRFAFVELSGGGLTQGCLAELLGTITSHPVRSFFFRLNQMRLVDNCIYYNFIPGIIKGSLIVEMMCRAPHGQVTAYEKNDNNQVVPVLEGTEVSALIDHGYLAFAKGVTDYCQERNIIDGNKECFHDLTLLLWYLEHIVEAPEQELLAYFGGMPNNVTGREKKVIEYAPKLSREELKQIFLIRKPEEPIEKYYPYSSLEYSLLRCSEEEQEFIQYCKEHYSDEIGREARGELTAPEAKYGRAEKYPCELLENKIILYGAGKFGVDLAGKLQDYPQIKVVSWVDSAIQEKTNQGVLNTPDIIRSADYNQIVIAVLKQSVAMEIKQQLLKDYHVPEEKIIWINLNACCEEWRIRG